MTDHGNTAPHPSRPVLQAAHAIAKKPTGIGGFDEMCGGGLPDQRLTTIVGSPGAGKTVFALTTLVNRHRMLGEPGVLVSFEEPVERLTSNAGSFRWNFDSLPPDAISFVDACIPPDADIGTRFDLIGLLAGLDGLIAETGAKNVVFDGIDVLLGNLDDEKLERQELARIDAWLRRAKLSVLMTAKSFTSGERDQRRSEYLQYMTDCVVLLESDVAGTTASRKLRISKYRGSGFAANPQPVVITPAGFEVIAFRNIRRSYPTFADRVSSGVERLDTLVGGGFIRGSSILISGSPGTSKTSLGAHFVAAACKRGERAMLISFDESASQIISNMRSIGLDLAAHVASGMLVMDSLVSGGRSPEEHFIIIRDMLALHAPRCLVIDPLSALLKSEYPFATLICEGVLDLAKSLGVTVLCTSLLENASGYEELSASHMSTLADTWMHVSYVARAGERNRALTIVKSRGSSHSHQVRELLLGKNGVELCDVYAAEGEVLMGAARLQKEQEGRRRKIEQDISYQRSRVQSDIDIATLRKRIELVMLELEWKERDAETSRQLEEERLQQERFASTLMMGTRMADAPEARGAASPAAEAAQ